MILVGNKVDRRKILSYADWSPDEMVTRTEAEQMVVQIGALCYLETSYNCMQNIDEPFAYAVRILHANQKPKANKKCSIQ